MSESDTVVGIDLGTTNSALAVVDGGPPRLIPVDGERLLPSVVGEAPDGSLLVGRAARNQLGVYPERCVRSVKRRMGEDTELSFGGRTMTPVEVSAVILRRLKQAAEQELGHAVDRAVITVPAYFSDAQRTATRQAGEVAGFTVERILNEPTAAALCYVTQREVGEQRVLVFDLGGGTFDVSVVRCGPEVTEVLASHGDTALGGDDMDAALSAHLRRCVEKQGVTVEGAGPLVRLSDAAERAKIALSTESWVQVSEEHLVQSGGVGVHLDEEVDRAQYEGLIEPLLQRTRDSVQRALRDAGLRTSELDDIILVGGATRTPRVAELLEELTGMVPRRDVDPDLTVALGASLQGARTAGREIGTILVDVTPYSFGTSHFGELDGMPSPDCYKAIIKRNSPLPARHTEVFYTMVQGQQSVEVEVLQGEQPNARDNILLGKFMVEGLDPKAPEGSPILFDLKLDLDGILDVDVVERATGLRKSVRIEDAFRKCTPEQVADQRARIEAEFAGPETEEAAREHERDRGAPSPPADLPAEQLETWTKAHSLLQKAFSVKPQLGREDQQELAELASKLEGAMGAKDFAEVAAASDELDDVLFYLDA
jgi:molecular chaperone DnaK (HSP70)